MFGNKLYHYLLIAFLEVLPHLSLIISYLMRDLVETQCCAVRNGKQCTISTPTLPLHMNEPSFAATFSLLNMQVHCYTVDVDSVIWAAKVCRAHPVLTVDCCLS